MPAPQSVTAAPVIENDVISAVHAARTARELRRGSAAPTRKRRQEIEVPKPRAAVPASGPSRVRAAALAGTGCVAVAVAALGLSLVSPHAPEASPDENLQVRAQQAVIEDSVITNMPEPMVGSMTDAPGVGTLRPTTDSSSSGPGSSSTVSGTTSANDPSSSNATVKIEAGTEVPAQSHVAQTNVAGLGESEPVPAGETMQAQAEGGSSGSDGAAARKMTAVTVTQMGAVTLEGSETASPSDPGEITLEQVQKQLVRDAP